LWEFDILTGEFERRNVKNAGQRRGFYLLELEQGLLQRLDSDAGEILNRGLHDRRGNILLRDVDRRRLAEWLALFLIRTPRSYDDVERQVEVTKNDPDAIVEIMYRNRERVTALARAAGPNACDLIAREYGETAAEDIILGIYETAIRSGSLRPTIDAPTVFNEHITTERTQLFARYLLRLHWTWFGSRIGFVVGDSPVCRWSTRTGKWDYGMAHRDVELTVPLTRSVCLRMRCAQSRASKLVMCNQRRTDEWNMRQMQAAHQYVYGSEAVLRPMAQALVARAIRQGLLTVAPRRAP
jgi:hypothetical protein